MVTAQVVRNFGHSWSRRPGFDLMYVLADTPEELDRARQTAQERFWEPWALGTYVPEGQTNLQPGGVFYKPCGARAPWRDDPSNPHPGNLVGV